MSDPHDASRRDFLRQAGTVAWATPLILTMAANPARAQVSCSPAGTACGTWSETLQTCLPLADDNPPAVICCGDCVQGSGPQSSFCYCN